VVQKFHQVTTTYAHNPLNDLTGSTQSGSRNRTFTYDSLGELLSASNPETGTLTYTFDTNGNVATKNDARSLSITYAYDDLNRLTSKKYSNGDPTVTYVYDGGTPCSSIGSFGYGDAVGRLTMTCDAGGTELWAYDPMGRVLADQRTTNGITKTTTAVYVPYVDGSVYQITYPSGLTITYAYSNAQRPISAVDQYGTSYANWTGTCPDGTPSDGACYAPHGSLAATTIGAVTGGFAGVNVTSTYNPRLQPVEMKAASSWGTEMDLTYNFSLGSSDNGDVVGIANNLDNTRSHAFSYDQLNRIATAGTQITSGSNCWGEQYTIDVWGNLTNIAPPSTYSGCTGESLNISVTSANQVTTNSYDASGNVLNDGVNQYTWNSESQTKTAAGVTYTYDAEGMRIEKSSGTLYWYGKGSEVLDESDLSGNIINEYVYFGGVRVARRQGSGSTATLYFYLGDHLASSRVITTSNGATCYSADFYPFGGERTFLNSCAQNYKFTGKERDDETGNDNFGARYYSSDLGRFLSPDWSSGSAAVPFANYNNPQTLNLYQFVEDDPESLLDLDGHGVSNPFIFDESGWQSESPGYWPDTFGTTACLTLTACYFAIVNLETNTITVYLNQPTAQAQQQNSINQQPTAQTQPSGINPNFSFDNIVCNVLPRVGKPLGDFSAGAGDVLSVGTTYLARKYIFDSDSVVDKGSGLYLTGAVTGAAIGVALGSSEMGPQGKIFGTRLGGNEPILNSGDTLRIGWSYIRSTGEYVFRIGGTAIGLIKDNPHINLWPPSWWFK